MNKTCYFDRIMIIKQYSGMILIYNWTMSGDWLTYRTESRDAIASKNKPKTAYSRNAFLETRERLERDIRERIERERTDPEIDWREAY